MPKWLLGRACTPLKLCQFWTNTLTDLTDVMLLVLKIITLETMPTMATKGYV